jgi:hypothetical protein
LAQLCFLKDEVGKLKYDYFVWLDPNNLFLRHPGDILRVLHGAPVHASLESNAASPEPLQPDWGICSLTNFTKLMRFKGVRSRGIFTVNGGFWIVQRDAIDNFYALAWDFWDFCKKLGYSFGFEHLLAYASQMLCGNPYLHTLKHNRDLWAFDYTRRYASELPSSGGWDYVDYFSGETFQVNPAIVQRLPGHRARVARERVAAGRSEVTAGL